MKRQKMERQVEAELERFLPRGPRGSQVNTVRAAFNALRRHDLSLNPATPVEVTLAEARRYSRQAAE